MRVFISWSGERSREIAIAVREWLPDVLHFVDAWMSREDIQAGQRWMLEVGGGLEASKFGILCITPESIQAPWVLFEAGAISKSVHESAVIPLLFDVSFAEIQGGPLGQFQAKKLDRDGIFELVAAINSRAEQPVPETRLRRVFDRSWPSLEEKIRAVPAGKPLGSTRLSTEEILEELVIAVRRIESRLALGDDTDPGGPLSTEMLNLIRDSIRRAAQERSLRSIARQIPMSPEGVRHFLNGATPYHPTARKLRRWYVESLSKSKPSSRTDFTAEPRRGADGPQQTNSPKDTPD
jgi:hypothetical protein